MHTGFLRALEIQLVICGSEARLSVDVISGRWFSMAFIAREEDDQLPGLIVAPAVLVVPGVLVVPRLVPRVVLLLPLAVRRPKQLSLKLCARLPC